MEKENYFITSNTVRFPNVKYDTILDQYSNLEKLYKINNDTLLKVYKDELNVYDDIIEYFFRNKINNYDKNLENLRVYNHYPKLYNFMYPSIFIALKEQSKKDLIEETKTLTKFIFVNDIAKIIADYSDNEEYILNNYHDQYFYKQDVIEALCRMDEYSRLNLIKAVCELYAVDRDLKYVISLMYTMYCQFSTYEILYQVYKYIDKKENKSNKCNNSQENESYQCENKEETQDAIDMNSKFCTKTTIFQFWKNLNEKQHLKILDWYNSKTPDQVMFHPCYRISLIDY